MSDHSISSDRTGVYCIRNTINGKRYMGSATTSFKKRWRQHRTDLRSNRHHSGRLQNSWNKHGEDSFVFEIIVICDSSISFIAEQAAIDSFQSANPKYGYNIRPNAGRGSGYKHSPETLARMKAIQQEIHARAEWKMKVSKANRGLVRSEKTRCAMRAANLGKTLSAEHRAKVSATLRGNKNALRKNKNVYGSLFD